MKLLGVFLLACVLLSVLQAALSILIIAGLIVGIFVRPTATLGLLVFGVFAKLMQSHPVGAIWLLSLILILVMRKPDRRETKTLVVLPPERSLNFRIK